MPSEAGTVRGELGIDQTLPGPVLPGSLSYALAAFPVALPSDVGVVVCELVPVGAPGDDWPPPEVLEDGDGLEVVGPDARLVAAEMVDGEPGRDGAEDEFVDDPVGSLVSDWLGYPDGAVTVGAAVSGPFPAAAVGRAYVLPDSLCPVHSRSPSSIVIAPAATARRMMRTSESPSLISQTLPGSLPSGLNPR
jgi:hypothetical protein